MKSTRGLAKRLFCLYHEQVRLFLDKIRITKEEAERTKYVFKKIIEKNPNAKIFPNAIFTEDKTLRQASKIMCLNVGGTACFVNLKTEEHKKDFEIRIG